MCFCKPPDIIMWPQSFARDHLFSRFGHHTLPVTLCSQRFVSTWCFQYFARDFLSATHYQRHFARDTLPKSLSWRLSASDILLATLCPRRFAHVTLSATLCSRPYTPNTLFCARVPGKGLRFPFVYTRGWLYYHCESIQTICDKVSKNVEALKCYYDLLLNIWKVTSNSLFVDKNLKTRTFFSYFIVVIKLYYTEATELFVL